MSTLFLFSIMANSLHVIVLIVIYVLNTTLALSHVDECLMLLLFKKTMSLNDTASFNSHAYPKVASWSKGMNDCCLWDGVECSSGHVTGLDLSSSYLYGPIFSNNSLFDVVHLRRLNLANNNFSLSQVPSGIGRLSQLENLNLSYSSFSGHVPKEISYLTQLVSLDLSGNQLKLQSPGFRNLVRNSSKTLKELFLSDVDISSEIPDILANASSLTSLVLRDCGLTGYFPLGIFDLPTLQHLDVQDNYQLVGQFPEFHGNMSQLKDLIIGGTKFHGQVPASIGNLVHLNQLDLHLCSFEGPLPISVSNLTQLTVLNLGLNNFSGCIPSLESLAKLTHLNLEYNNFDRSNLCDLLGKFHTVSYLDLSGNHLNCEMPSSIGNLTQLREIYLSRNDMVGQIPSSVTNLTHLTTLGLCYNKFTGRLPSLESLLNLKYLSLGSNGFDRWGIPDWLGKLTKIIHLNLRAANMYGEIPISMFNLTKLEVLYLSKNQLNGPISSSFSNLKSLTDISLLDNNFSGTIEVDIFLSLKKLKNLNLGGNKFTLSALSNHPYKHPPQFTFLNLESCNLRAFPQFLQFQHHMRFLVLDNNQIEGLIPKWMWNVSKETIFSISLTRNLLTGFEQHSPVAHLVNLDTLDLRHNMLLGSIPVPPPTIKYFLVSNNMLTEEIPPSICDLRSLQLLDLSFNNITGPIPPCFGKLSNSLSELNLRRNNLQGTIPDTFTNECKLRMINFSENKLKGQVPRSLKNCASLIMVDLGYNNMKDTFPFMLGALSALEILILKSNEFHGLVRFSSKRIHNNFPKLRIISLSCNSFSGDLPQQYFRNWSAMKVSQATAEYMHMYFELTDLFATSEIYWSAKNYSYSMNIIRKGVNTEYEKIPNIFIAVDLSSNKFGGIIPESIKDLKALQLLNLSNNEFSGIIPPSIGSLRQLESLDLSNNKLSGKIPQELAQLNFLSVLDVSYNNLTGPVPRGTQFDTFQNNSYRGNSALCGYPLSARCDNSEVLDPLDVSSDQNTESDHFPSGVDWFVILSGLGSGLVIGLVFGNQLTTRCYIWFLIRFRRCRRRQE